MPPASLISVVIATTCERRRQTEIRRAIGSVRRQGLPLELIVVVNGSRFDPALFEELKADASLRVEYLAEGSFPAAVRHGRHLVRGEYFAFLDDDDEYLDGALALRLAAFTEDPRLDFVATNGLLQQDSGSTPFVTDVQAVLSDPMAANYRFNWLGSSAALFRTASVPAELFDGTTKHFEWTWLTFQLLAAGKQVRFLDTATFFKYSTPDSLSKDQSLGPLETELLMLTRMSESASPVHRPLVQRKLRGTLHALSRFHARAGEVRPAWAYHWATIRRGGLFHYAKYTARLVQISLFGGSPKAPRLSSDPAAGTPVNY